MPKRRKGPLQARVKNEAQYRKELTAEIRKLEKFLRKARVGLENEIGLGLEGLTKKQVNKLLVELRKKVKRAQTNSIKTVRRAIKTTARDHKKQFVELMSNELGVDVSKLLNDKQLKQFVNSKLRENVSLIKDLTDGYARRVEQVFLRALSNPGAPVNIVKDLAAAGKFTRNRAKLIVRDQTAKMNASVNQIRQSAIGITHYRWFDSDDIRVRPAHARNDGRVFRWDKPPKTGHPGDDINCRCSAVPILPAEITGEKPSLKRIQSRARTIRADQKRVVRKRRRRAA